MLEYFSLCFLCIVALVLTVQSEPKWDDIPTFTKLCAIIFMLPLIPVALLLVIILKLIRND